MRLAIVRQLAGSAECVCGYVCDGESGTLLGIISELDVSDSQFAEPELSVIQTKASVFVVYTDSEG